MARKVVQFSSSVGPAGDVLFSALCDDGTMWVCVTSKHEDWTNVRPIPQPKGEE